MSRHPEQRPPLPRSLFARTGLPLAVLLMGAVSAPALAVAAAHRVAKVDVTGDASQPTVAVRGWHEPTFSVFRLDEPQRVVIDLKDTDVGAVAAAGVVAGKGPVLSVTARQFDDAQTSVGRLVIAIKDGTHYDVQIVGDDLTVAFRAETSAATKTLAQSSPADSAASPPAAATAPVAVVAPPAATPSVDPTPAPPAVVAEGPATASAPAESPATAAASSDNKVVQTREDRLPGEARGGSRLLDVRLTGDGERASLFLRADGLVVGYRVIELKEPGRVALDLEGFTHSAKPKVTAAGPITDVRVGVHGDRVRVVLEAKTDRFPPFSVKRAHGGLAVSIGEPRPVPVAATAPAPVAPVVAVKDATPVTVASAAHAAPTSGAATHGTATASATTASIAKASPPVEVKSLDVSGRGRTARIVLAVDGAVETSEQTLPDGGRMLVLKNTRLPKELARRLDTSALEGPIASVASYEDASDGSVRIVAALRTTEPDVTDKVATLRMGESTGLSWSFAGNGTRRISIATASHAPGGFMGEAPAYAMNAGPRASGYTGRRVDFTAKDLDIIQFLQAIGEIAKRNIVASEDVSGKINIRLRNVPWDEALDIVLRSKGLDKEEIGSVMRIAPADKIRAEHQARAAFDADQKQHEPLKVRLIPVNFATAQGIATKIRDLLSNRGTVTVDERTNMLIVKDITEALTKAELLVRTLDTQTPQVLIEARIVEASTTFSRSFGIQWGGNTAASPANGTQTGLVFPNTVAVQGVSNDGPTSGNGTTPNYVVNFPTAVGLNNGAGLGFIFGSAGGASVLNLRLTAAELGGVIKTVSAPKTVTLDNMAATIGQGVSIPYAVVSAAGANTAFIQARLELSVTPHVTSDGSIVMKISVTNNQPNTALTGSNGAPSINTREANTNVLVKDGDTTVIGGIYTRTTSKSDNNVPFLSQIPILGALFSHSVDTDDRTELLIFISPRIVNRDRSAIQSGDQPIGETPAPPPPVPAPM